MNGIAALAADNVWAVGAISPDSLILHWDGAHWQAVPTPPVFHPDIQPGREDRLESRLAAVTALGANDIWAVGTSGNQGWDGNTTLDAYFPLIEHWDGQTWSIVAHPDVPGSLNAVAATAPQDVWAVGSATNGAFPYDGSRPLILHWNGQTWQEVTPPLWEDLWLAAATATGHEVWIVGWYTGGSAAGDGEILHWDGTEWHEARIHTPTGPIRLTAVTARTADDVWATGNTVLHWDGRTWHEFPPVYGYAPKFADTPQVSEFNLRAIAVSNTGFWVGGDGTDTPQAYDIRSCTPP